MFLFISAVKYGQNLVLNICVECRVLSFGKNAAFREGRANCNFVAAKRHVRDHLELAGKNLVDDRLVDFGVVALALCDERHNVAGEGISCHHCGDFDIADIAFLAAGEQNLLDAYPALDVEIQQRVYSESLEELFALNEVNVVPRSVPEHLGILFVLLVAGEQVPSSGFFENVESQIYAEHA